MNIRAARIGPTVCELDGPIPIENNSNVLIAMVTFLIKTKLKLISSLVSLLRDRLF